MSYTPETIDPAAMTSQDYRSIASDPQLVQAYAMKTVAEASAAVRSERPDADQDERTWRTYDKLDEVLSERLANQALIDQVMQQSGKYAEMHQEMLKRSAEKEVRKMLDGMSMRHDVPRALLVQVKDGVAFKNADDGITFHTLGKEPIKFNSPADFVEWAVSAKVPEEQWHKALEVVQATRNLANMSTPQDSNAPEVKNIGSLMPKPQWAEARDAVSTPGQTNGKVFLPKPMNEYAGKIVFLTDTHLVQQVGKNSAVTHDLSKLDNGPDLAKDFDAKKIGPRTNIVIRYGEGRGAGEIIPFNVQRAAEVKKHGLAWAEEKIPNERTRAAFVKHLEAWTNDMAKGAPLQQSKPGIAPRAPDRAPQLDRPR